MEDFEKEPIENTELETESTEGREDTESVVDESPTEVANEDVVDDTSSEEVSPNETVETEVKEKESFIPGVSTLDDENHYTTPMDFSWLDDKAKDVSTMTEERKKEDANDELKKQIKDFADLSGEVQGLFTKEEIQAISDKINDKPNAVQSALGTVADFLVPFAGKEIKDTIAPPQMENPKAYVEALVRFKENNPNGYAESKKALDEAYEGSRKGSFTHGLDYYSMTGDTNGNAYAKQVDSIIKSLPEDTPKEVINAILNPDPITREQINTLSMEAEKNAKVRALAIEEASTVTAATALGLAAPYIKSGVGKLMEKLPEGLGTKIAEKMASITLRGGKGQEFWDNLMNKTVEFNGRHLRLGTIVNLERTKTGGYTYTAADFLKRASKIGMDPMTLIKDALEESGLHVIEKGATKAAGGISMKTLSSLVADAAVESGFGKKGAAVAGVASLATAANAVPTGIFDEKGRMVDSKEIVKERQGNPYTGEDKVTLQSREGSVTVDPREAVIVGESESLTPTQGYTEEVKKLAQEEKREVYEKEPVEMVQPTQRDLSVFDKAVDYVQAILGGRDLNNDKTITNSEWYQSTIGPVVDSMKSLPDLKSVAKDVGNKVERFVDRVGGNIAASIPGVINLSTGEIQVVDREVPATEDMAKLLQTKVVDSLPSWGDDAQSDAMKSVVANTVMENLAPMYGNVGVITLVKAAGTYATETIAEICHLNDYDLSNDQKGMINFAITNAIGLTFEPVSTIIRDVTSGYGILQRGKIEAALSGETPTESAVYIVPYEAGSEVESEYGVGKERVDADTQYSGYREQAKESNIATDYNRGLEKNVNTAVSDKIVKVFNSEPDYIKNAIRKILVSYKELH